MVKGREGREGSEERGGHQEGATRRGAARIGLEIGLAAVALSDIRRMQEGGAPSIGAVA